MALPHPLTSVMQLSITAASLCVAAAAIAYVAKTASDERNARLVEIGIGVLKVDPTKETQVSAARKWALDLIDANAGGVKFSQDARTELLGRPLRWIYIPDYGSAYYSDYESTYIPGKGSSSKGEIK